MNFRTALNERPPGAQYRRSTMPGKSCYEDKKPGSGGHFLQRVKRIKTGGKDDPAQ